MRQKLSKSVVDALAPGERDTIHWDRDLKGFGVKVTPAGRKVFIVQHRPKGHDGSARKYTIGAFGKVTVQQARERAQAVLLESARGVDIGAKEREKRKKRASEKLADLVGEFIDKHVSQFRSAKETMRIFERDILPAIGHHSIHDIRRKHVIELVEGVAERGSPIMANRVLAALRKFLNWCVGRGILESSPANGFTAPARERSRERVLSESEIAAVLLAARATPFPFGPIVQLLFLTAQRRDEVGGMRWSEIDVETRIWTIPPERIKNAKGHDVHLSDAAIAILHALPRLTGPDGEPSDLVFTTNGRTPFSGYSKAKRLLDEKSGTTDWRLHDIRRTVTTNLAAMGVPIHVADAILNHKSGVISGVAAVYQRHSFMAEREKALRDWGDWVVKNADAKRYSAARFIKRAKVAVTL